MGKTNVKVLLNGFVEFDENTFDGHAQPTMTLIEDEGNIIVVDPGTVKDINDLRNSLREEGYGFEDVTHVVVTHEHHDHYRNMGLFSNAVDVNFWGDWNGMYLTFSQKERNLSENVKVLMTPGHDKSGISLIVNASDGKYAISGDVFYDKYGPKKDEFCEDGTQLISSRERLLKMAEYIVPGHGDLFKSSDYSPR